jgi:O-antigen ligase
MEEGDYIHSSQLPSLIAALAAAAMVARLLPLQPFSLLSLILSNFLSFCSQIMPLFIGNNDRQEVINHGTNGEQKS